MKIIKTELGIEKICGLCGESWPLDEDFFYRRGSGWHSYCKACCTLRTAELRAGAVRKVKLYKRKGIKNGNDSRGIDGNSGTV